MLVVALGKEDICTDVHGLAPKLGEELTLDLDELDPRGVPRVPLLEDLAGPEGFDGRNDLGQGKTDGLRLGRVEIEFLYLAVGVARGDPWILTVAGVLVEGHHMPVRAVEDGVHVQESLHIIFPRRNLGQVPKGISSHFRIPIGDHHGLARGKVLYVLSPERNAGHIDLLPWFARPIFADDHVDPPHHRDLEAKLGNLRGRMCTEDDLKLE